MSWDSWGVEQVQGLGDGPFLHIDRPGGLADFWGRPRSSVCVEVTTDYCGDYWVNFDVSYKLKRMSPCGAAWLVVVALRITCVGIMIDVVHMERLESRVDI
jgi:hypothetical protein